jgi:hypothetical protein
MNVGIAFDYNTSVVQQVSLNPTNFSPAWGDLQLWGSSSNALDWNGNTWGGPSAAFQRRIFPSMQKCQTFQLTIQEQYDPSFGIPAGEGLSISGLKLVVGTKKGYVPLPAVQSAG